MDGYSPLNKTTFVKCGIFRILPDCQLWNVGRQNTAFLTINLRGSRRGPGFGWEIELSMAFASQQPRNAAEVISATGAKSRYGNEISALSFWRAALQAVFFWWCVLDYFTKSVGFKCFEKLHLSWFESRNQNIHIGFKVTVFPSWQFHSSLDNIWSDEHPDRK